MTTDFRTPAPAAPDDRPKSEVRFRFVAAGTLSLNASILRLAALGMELGQRDWRWDAVLRKAADSQELMTRLGVQEHIRWVQGPNPLGYAAVPLPERGARTIWHLINATAAGLCAVIWRRRPGDYVVSDWDELLSSTNFPLHRRLQWRLMELVAYRLSDRFIVASRHLESRLRLCLPKMPIAYIPYGYHRLCTSSAADLKEPIVSETPTICFLGNLSPAYAREHGQIVLLAGCCKRRKLNLLIVGDGTERQTLMEQLRQAQVEDSCSFAGFVENVDAVLTHPSIQAFFLPIEDTEANRSRCPNKLFLYMSGQKPIITNPVGEVAIQLKNEGIYYRYNDRDSLDQAVAAALQTNTHYNLEMITWQQRANDYLQFLMPMLSCP